MRSTALTFEDEYDEVLVSSTAVLEANIAAVRASLDDFKTQVGADFTNVEGEIKSVREDLKFLREKSDKAFERLYTKFDAEIKETNRALGELTRTVLRIDSRQSAVVWVCGGLGVLLTVAISVGKAFRWF